MKKILLYCLAALGGLYVIGSAAPDQTNTSDIENFSPPRATSNQVEVPIVSPQKKQKK